jgi:HrpA-like RNA helicase
MANCPLTNSSIRQRPKIFVSQPTRLAARAMTNRVRATLGRQVRASLADLTSSVGRWV